MRRKPSPSQLKSMRAAFAPLTIATAIPLELPPIRIIGVPPTRLPSIPAQPEHDDMKNAA